jgi:hypothetical protein
VPPPPQNDSENESTDNIGLPTYTSSPIQKNQTVIINNQAKAR